MRRDLFVKKQFLIDDDLYDLLKECTAVYKADLSDLINECVAAYFREPVFVLPTKPKRTFAFYHTICLTKQNCAALEQMRAQYGFSYSRLINIAISFALKKDEKEAEESRHAAGSQCD